MNQSKFDAMSDTELRTYFLANRHDQTAFHAHLDRLNQQSPTIVANPNDPNFDEKLQALIRQKLEATQNPTQDDEMQPEYDLKSLRVRKLGPGRNSFGESSGD